MLEDEIMQFQVDKSNSEAKLASLKSFLEQIPTFCKVDLEDTLTKVSDLPNEVSDLMSEALPLLPEEKWETESYFVCDIPDFGTRLCKANLVEKRKSGISTSIRKRIAELDRCIDSGLLKPVSVFEILNRNRGMVNFTPESAMPSLLLLSDLRVSGWLTGSHPFAIRNEEDFAILRRHIVQIIGVNRLEKQREAMSRFTNP